MGPVKHYLYVQGTGELFALTLLGVGYAGHGTGRNNPAAQAEHNVGPLPQGNYTMGAPHTNPKTGPVTLDLTPDKSNEMFGRTDFRIHGDNSSNDASEGCPVQPRPVRELLMRGDRLAVVAIL